MQPTITVVRAIGAEFASRALRPLIIGGTLLHIALLALGGWLTTLSGWWWILEVLFIIGALLFTIIAVTVHIVLRAIRPSLTKVQKRSVATFVDKLERVAEHLQTPQPFIIFFVVRDTIWPRQGGFVETVATDSRTLGPDFTKLRKDMS